MSTPIEIIIQTIQYTHTTGYDYCNRSLCLLCTQPVSQILSNHSCPHRFTDSISPIWYAQLTLNSVALVPSVIFCPQMPQRLLSLPLFFHVLIIATLFFLAVLSISKTNYRRFRTTLLALFCEFLKRTTFLLILLLFIGCPLYHGYSTNSLLSVIIA